LPPSGQGSKRFLDFRVGKNSHDVHLAGKKIG
jgi:hypothetical protein